MNICHSLKSLYNAWSTEFKIGSLMKPQSCTQQTRCCWNDWGCLTVFENGYQHFPFFLQYSKATSFSLAVLEQKVQDLGVASVYIGVCITNLNFGYITVFTEDIY